MVPGHLPPRFVVFPLISNVGLKEMAPILFAHTGSLVVPEIFAGRESEMKRLLSHMEGVERGSVLVLSEPLGTGKTTFLGNASRALADKGLLATEREDSAIVGIREFSEEYVDELAADEVLILDEVDRKHKREKAMNKLSLINERLGESFSQLILSGDQSVTDRADLREVLDNAKSVEWLGMKALTPELLFEALQKRAGYYFRDDDRVAEELPEIFEPAFLRRFIPDTDPPVATFRESLKLLSELASSPSAVPLNEGPCRFSAESCDGWFAEMPPVTDDQTQVEFLLWLGTYLDSLEQVGEPFRALATEEWFALHPIGGIDDPEQYEERILDPLVRADVLRGFGVPFAEGTGKVRRDPGPYLPSVKTFLRTAFDPAWP